MTRFLLDEMFPAQAAALLREDHDHDALHVTEVGLGGVDDAAVAAAARSERWVVVTENVADFAAEHDLVLVFILKERLPSDSAQAAALADVLQRWALANPQPYVGPHWPH